MADAAEGPMMPWDRPELEGWQIVGMNHYHQDGQRRLFVAMTRSGTCIQAEGSDEAAVFERLAEMAKGDCYLRRNRMGIWTCTVHGVFARPEGHRQMVQDDQARFAATP